MFPKRSAVTTDTGRLLKPGIRSTSLNQKEECLPHRRPALTHVTELYHRLQSRTLRLFNTRNNQVTKDKCKNISNRSQYTLEPSEPSSPIMAIPGYPSISEKKDSDLNYCLIKIIEAFKDDINSSFKEAQKNTGKQIKTLKAKTYKCIKEIQVKELKQMAIDLKKLK